MPKYTFTITLDANGRNPHEDVAAAVQLFSQRGATADFYDGVTRWQSGPLPDPGMSLSGGANVFAPADASADAAAADAGRREGERWRDEQLKSRGLLPPAAASLADAGSRGDFTISPPTK